MSFIESVGIVGAPSDVQLVACIHHPVEQPAVPIRKTVVHNGRLCASSNQRPRS
jgi:hypothetical protein